MPRKPAAPGYLPQGYKESKVVRRVDGPPGTNNTETEHWDGRQDATIRPQPLRATRTTKQKE